MQTYHVKLTGRTPLLLHNDNLEWADHMEAWKNNPENKRNSKAGDDRTPAWRWIGACYHDGKVIALPQGNIMRSIMEGGAMVPVPGGRSGKTFKAQTQSGMMSVDPYWALCNEHGQLIDWPSVLALKDIQDFGMHLEAVKDLGFTLNVKRAAIGKSKHIRVRPEFAVGWSCMGQLAVWDAQITETALLSILTYAGQYKGLCDWRPGGRTPGPYGTFEATLKQIG